MAENFTTCPGCGLVLPNLNLPISNRYNSSEECLQLFDELTAMNLSEGREEFIHQVALDAYTAQHASEMMKAITIPFALITLCLVTEHNFTGRQAQLVHMKIPKQQWEKIQPTSAKTNITVKDILQADDLQRPEQTKKWAAAVWNAWEHEHEWLREKVKELI